MGKLHDATMILKDIGLIAGDVLKIQVDSILEAYKETLTNLLVWVLLVLTSIILGFIGLGFFLQSGYIQLALMTGPVAAGLIIGIMLILAAVAVFLYAKTKM